jgi:hypothetical protein
MRQVVGFLQAINKANLTDFYHQLLAFGTVQGAKLPSLDEFLNASLNKNEPIESFDEKTDEFLEQHAQKLLNERRANFGQ